MKKNPAHPHVSDWLSQPIIPVVAQVSGDRELLGRASLIFLQGGEISDLGTTLDWLKSGPCATVPVLLHIDLLAGLSSDEAGLRYLAGMNRLQGIITVRSHLVTAARRLGMAAILRLFLQDGRSVERGLHLIEQARPDVIELIPGVAAMETADRFARVTIPRIAGGLIRTADTARRIIASGCRAISTSNAELWQLNSPTAT